MGFDGMMDGVVAVRETMMDSKFGIVVVVYRRRGLPIRQDLAAL
jgi:hypothetical protein